jgi:hypothetical protein
MICSSLTIQLQSRLNILLKESEQRTQQTNSFSSCVQYSTLCTAHVRIQGIQVSHRIGEDANVLGTGVPGTSMLETGVLKTNVLGPSVLGTSVLETNVLGPSVLGTGVLGTSVLGTGVLGTGVLGTGVLGTGVLGTSVLGTGVLESNRTTQMCCCLR